MDYYTSLGIERSADAHAITSAYRRKAVKFHPDRTRDVNAVLEFGWISEAFDVLMNSANISVCWSPVLCSLEEWRALYDLYGVDVLKNGMVDTDGGRIGGCYAFDPKTDPLKIFQRVFATRNPYTAMHDEMGQDLLAESEDLDSYTPPKYGPDKKIEFHCSLEEVFYGCTKVLELKKLIQTDTSDTESETEELKKVKIPVLPGDADGTAYVFPREGDVQLGKKPGNVIYILRILPHERFHREDRNLVCKLQIPIHQAFLNVPNEIETLDKRMLSVVLPCILTPGYRHVIKGEGMQFPNRTRGDLIVEISLVFQKELGQLQKSLIKSAFLFPALPTADQLQAAKAFNTSAQDVTKGWLSGVPKRDVLN